MTWRSKEVDGASRYIVCENGDVYSKRSKRTRNCINQKRLLNGNMHDGYKRYALKMDDGTVKHIFGHVLVLEAFIGKRPDGMDACHADCNRSNNHIANLRWDTRKNNIHDSIKAGLFQFGEKSGLAKLTEEQVRNIRKNATLGLSSRKQAKQYGVSHSTILHIINMKTWRRAS